MIRQEWLFTKEVEEKEIRAFESKFRLTLPIKYVETVLEFNGGRPRINVFDTDKTKECVFEQLLSFNRNDKELMERYYESSVNQRFLPIGIDGFGNEIAFDISDYSVHFLNHEEKRREFIASSWEQFLDLLYI